MKDGKGTRIWIDLLCNFEGSSRQFDLLPFGFGRAVASPVLPSGEAGVVQFYKLHLPSLTEELSILLLTSLPQTQLTSPGGGMRTTTNRTLWPTTGGAIALQPGWFQGHATAFFYMNMGFGTNGPDNGPPNMSFPMVPVFQIVGPSKNPYPGTFCLPQVPLPSGIPTPNVGDNATIQVVETAIHGAALYSVSLSFPNFVEGRGLTTTSA